MRQLHHMVHNPCMKHFGALTTRKNVANCILLQWFCCWIRMELSTFWKVKLALIKGIINCQYGYNILHCTSPFNDFLELNMTHATYPFALAWNGMKMHRVTWPACIHRQQAISMMWAIEVPGGAWDPRGSVDTRLKWRHGGDPQKLFMPVIN
jgi:hypothetical protein